jgi:hypothetical protein
LQVGHDLKQQGMFSTGDADFVVGKQADELLSVPGFEGRLKTSWPSVTCVSHTALLYSGSLPLNDASN